MKVRIERNAFSYGAGLGIEVGPYQHVWLNDGYQITLQLIFVNFYLTWHRDSADR